MRVRKFFIRGQCLERCTHFGEKTALTLEEAGALAEREVMKEGMPPGARPTLIVVFSEEGKVLGAAESFRDGHTKFSVSTDDVSAIAEALAES